MPPGRRLTTTDQEITTMNANPAFDQPGFGPGFGPFGPRIRGRFRGPRPPFGPRAAPADAQNDPTGDDTDPRRERLRHARRRGGFGPGFGGPGPFGPGFGPGHRGRGRGRGRRTARGDIRLAVLALVAEQPRHGYEIIQEIAERSSGAWRPSPGSVYPTLSQLEDEGLVSVEKAEGRRVVSLTEAGTTYVAEHREELDKVWESVNDDSDDDGARALFEQLHQLHAAAQQVAATGTPEQIATASASVTEARKAIYRLLAE
jgi:DNA-binding PadR family transcriptional regulator